MNQIWETVRQAPAVRYPGPNNTDTAESAAHPGAPDINLTRTETLRRQPGAPGEGPLGAVATRASSAGRPGGRLLHRRRPWQPEPAAAPVKRLPVGPMAGPALGRMGVRGAAGPPATGLFCDLERRLRAQTRVPARTPCRIGSAQHFCGL